MTDWGTTDWDNVYSRYQDGLKDLEKLIETMSYNDAFKTYTTDRFPNRQYTAVDLIYSGIEGIETGSGERLVWKYLERASRLLTILWYRGYTVSIKDDSIYDHLDYYAKIFVYDCNMWVLKNANDILLKNPKDTLPPYIILINKEAILEPASDIHAVMLSSKDVYVDGEPIVAPLSKQCLAMQDKNNPRFETLTHLLIRHSVDFLEGLTLNFKGLDWNPFVDEEILEVAKYQMVGSLLSYLKSSDTGPIYHGEAVLTPFKPYRDKKFIKKCEILEKFVVDTYPKRKKYELYSATDHSETFSGYNNGDIGGLYRWFINLKKAFADINAEK
jgi:hypothetical protein